MSVKIKDNTSNVINNKLVQSSIFLRMFADEVVNIATPITPKDYGRLRSDVIKQVLGLKGAIIWAKEYAQIQEYKQHSNYTTPGTGAHFAQKSINEAIKKSSSLIKKVFN